MKKVAKTDNRPAPPVFRPAPPVQRNLARPGVGGAPPVYRPAESEQRKLPGPGISGAPPVYLPVRSAAALNAPHPVGPSRPRGTVQPMFATVVETITQVVTENPYTAGAVMAGAAALGMSAWYALGTHTAAPTTPTKEPMSEPSKVDANKLKKIEKARTEAKNELIKRAGVSLERAKKKLEEVDNVPKKFKTLISNYKNMVNNKHDAIVKLLKDPDKLDGSLMILTDGLEIIYESNAGLLKEIKDRRAELEENARRQKEEVEQAGRIININKAMGEFLEKAQENVENRYKILAKSTKATHALVSRGNTAACVVGSVTESNNRISFEISNVYVSGNPQFPDGNNLEMHIPRERDRARNTDCAEIKAAQDIRTYATSCECNQAICVLIYGTWAPCSYCKTKLLAIASKHSNVEIYIYTDEEYRGSTLGVKKWQKITS